MKIKTVFVLTSMLLSFSASAQDSMSKGDFVMLVDPLDEPEFYCFDLAGWGASLQLDDPLQNHTCKGANGADQMFEFSGDRLQVSGTDRCVQVGGSSGKTLPGSAVLARTCSDSQPLQELSLTNTGKIMVGNTGYCIGSGTSTRDASGPSHVWRTLTVVDCDATDSSLTTWQVGM